MSSFQRLQEWYLGSGKGVLFREVSSQGCPYRERFHCITHTHTFPITSMTIHCRVDPLKTSPTSWTRFLWFMWLQWRGQRSIIGHAPLWETHVMTAASLRRAVTATPLRFSSWILFTATCVSVCEVCVVREFYESEGVATNQVHIKQFNGTQNNTCCPGWDSNPRHSANQAECFPTELLRQLSKQGCIQV